jgi:hypothetical protein
MTRLAALFWLGLVLASGFLTFSVKYTVQGIDDQLRQTRKQTVADEEQIRVLTAEWAYLNRPSRLADLNQRFLHLEPIAAKQLAQRIEDIPLRAPPVATAEVPAAPLAGDGAEWARRLLAAADPPAVEPKVAPPRLPIAAVAYRRQPTADTPVVRIARASPVAGSLDALFAQVAERR